MRPKFLIVGAGGREAAFAVMLAKDSIVYAIIGHKNPQIIDCTVQSGGEFMVGDSDDPQTVLDFAQKHKVDYVFVNADQPLANGVVDILLDHNIRAIGGTKAATRIEWDKVYSIQMVNKVCPEFTPFYKIVSSVNELSDAVSEFESRKLDLVVKPQGLTGGKGVKVMPEHLSSYQDCIEYSKTILQDRKEKVLLVEKLDGIEFTIMGITDGKNLLISPATYDYPFRFADDTGPGTGGMGCFTGPEKKLPFMTDADMADCTSIMQRIIDEMQKNDLLFNGVLNGGFFKTAHGIRFMEFNGRFGDPECLNVLCVLDGSFSKLLIDIYNKRLTQDSVSFVKKSSVVKYLVAKEYPNPSPDAIPFTINQDAMNDLGVEMFFASCVKTGQNQYETIKKSRVVGFVAISDDISAASLMVNEAIDKHVTGDLQYREDIGSTQSLTKLEKICQKL